MSGEIEYGGIYWVTFSSGVGHEFQGRRPGVVIQSNRQLKRTNLVTVMPLTSQIGKSHGDDIFVNADKVNNLYADSLVKAHNIESFDQSRFIKRIGKMDEITMEKIKKYLKAHFNL